MKKIVLLFISLQMVFFQTTEAGVFLKLKKRLGVHYLTPTEVKNAIEKEKDYDAFIKRHGINVKVGELLDFNEGLSSSMLDTSVRIPGPKAVSFVEALLKNGARPSEKTVEKAVRSKNPKMITLLLKYHKNINDRIGDYAPLHIAAKEGNLDLVNELIKKGAQIDVRSRLEETPFMLAIATASVNIPMATLLLSKGANINAKGGVKDNSALHHKSKNGDVKMVNYLLAHKADPNSRNYKKETPLHFAPSKIIAESLIKAGTQINAQDSHGKSPLMSALEIKTGKGKELANYLIEQGAKLDQKDEDGQTILTYAIKNNDQKMIDYLIKKNSRLLYEKDKKEKTPLHHAVDLIKPETLIKLLQYKIDVNQRDVAGNTALIDAAKKDKETHMRVLLEHGANPLLRDYDGKRASELAKDPEIKEMLIRYENQQSPQKVTPKVPTKPAEITKPVETAAQQYKAPTKLAEINRQIEIAARKYNVNISRGTKGDINKQLLNFTIQNSEVGVRNILKQKPDITAKSAALHLAQKYQLKAIMNLFRTSAN